MYSRPIFAHRPARGGKGASAFTLVEILVALTLTLILMTTVVTVFGRVGTSMRNARRALEQFDRLRTAAQQLNVDLNGITARLDGRAGRPEEGLGYFELIEGSYLFGTNGPNGTSYGINSNVATTDPRYYDYTVGERGDILLFTSRNAARPFVGRFGFIYDSSGNPQSAQTIQSDVAEVAWFLRGNRLHRRVLLIVPGAATAVAQYPKVQFYNDYDLSAHIAKNASGQTVIVPNSLADLVKRENRFAHDATVFPFDVRQWGSYGLPTLAECTSPTFMKYWAGGSTPPLPYKPPLGPVDLWNNSPASTNPLSMSAPPATNLSDQALTSGKNDALRVADDVVLTNVIGFDVKVWEPAANGGAGGYVDLGTDQTTGMPGVDVSITPGQKNQFQTPPGPSRPRFNNGGIIESGLSGSGTTPRVYDSGCFSYANELGNGQATNGLDDNSSGVVDDISEYVINNPSPPPTKIAPGVSPYPVPLRGIQITIRCFEPDSKQIREITIEHDFLPK